MEPKDTYGDLFTTQRRVLTFLRFSRLEDEYWWSVFLSIIFGVYRKQDVKVNAAREN